MNVLKIVAFSIISIAALFGITKLIGYRQLSQMSMFDYINGITIGSMAADMAMDSDRKFFDALIALLVYGFVAVLLSKITNKFPKIRKVMNGKPIVLFYRGKIDKSALAFASLDLNEFQMQCRNAGYFDMSSIKFVLLEANGKISIMPYSPDELNNNTGGYLNDITVNVIMDGVIMKENLRLIGKNEKWLMDRLTEEGVISISDVFLGEVTRGEILKIYSGDGNFKKIGDLLE